VSKINPVTDTVTATVPVGSGPYAVAFDGTNIWVTNLNSNNVSKIIPF
jgi:DNA-binding beta-propeller fold protein YncE